MYCNEDAVIVSGEASSSCVFFIGYAFRMRVTGVFCLFIHLPDTELVGEVEQRTECRSGREQHTGKRHFLG